MKEKLVDPFGRTVNYLRMSVTDRCDFRCVYCMDEEMTFLPRKQILTLEEMVWIAQAFAGLGVQKIRLTGGEPLVRSNLPWLAEQISSIEGISELVMTSNGSRLDKFAGPLKQAGMGRLNISLDTLDDARFTELTRVGKLSDVLRGIDAAISAGFSKVKLNAVILRGRNDDEVESLVDFAVKKGVDISFIEEMPLGSISEHSRKDAFVSSAEIREKLTARWELTESSSSATDGPSRYVHLANTNTRVGFISPHSNNFCGECNRVRLTAEGRLLLCLGNEHSADLRSVVREHPGDIDILQNAIISALQLKPEKHHFELNDDVSVVRFMNMTGG